MLGAIRRMRKLWRVARFETLSAEAFVALDDPHSFILLQVSFDSGWPLHLVSQCTPQALKQFIEVYDLPIIIRLLPSRTKMYQGEADQQIAWQAKDAALLAQLYDYTCPRVFEVCSMSCAPQITCSETDQASEEVSESSGHPNSV
jgi:hypothetical protein